MTGPRFLSDIQTISSLLFFSEWRQRYCILVRLDFGLVLYFSTACLMFEEKFFIASSTSGEASGGFHLVGM